MQILVSSAVSSMAPRPCKYVKGGNVKSGTAAQFHSSQNASPRVMSATAAFGMRLTKRLQGGVLLLGSLLTLVISGGIVLSIFCVIMHFHLAV
jgi:hypothetical protein